MKQFRVLACMFVILSLVLAGCGGGQSDASTGEDAAMEEKNEMAEETMDDDDMMVEFTQQVVQ